MTKSGGTICISFALASPAPNSGSRDLRPCSDEGRLQGGGKRWERELGREGKRREGMEGKGLEKTSLSRNKLLVTALSRRAKH